MLSMKEIADYVHGPTELLEKQQFGFSELKEITMTAVSSEAKEERSRKRTGGLIEMHGTRRNVLLILLFVVIFAVMFVLNTRQAPANPVHAHPWSTSSLGPSM